MIVWRITGVVARPTESFQVQESTPEKAIPDMSCLWSVQEACYRRNRYTIVPTPSAYRQFLPTYYAK